ncbi:MAG: DUF2914 domain-containing protein [Gammaproteobacteria bacterium]|nr:DUF2914 domain-containing protein [Gammaproteobacteria bacterium]
MKKLQLSLIGILSVISCLSWAENTSIAETTAEETAAAEISTESVPSAEAAASNDTAVATDIIIANDGTVARSVFTSAVDNREPADQIGQLSNDNGLIYFFTELQGMEGRTITHRWEKDGEIKAEVSFNVGGNRWRVWSSKNLQPEWLGNWQVSIIDESGNMISQESFAYIPAADVIEGAQTVEAASATETKQEMDSTATTPAINEADLMNISPAAGSADK